MVVNIKTQLLEIGFSEYEARAYLGLLKQHPSTAYQAAKQGGLPSSKIYEVLSRLIEKGVVLEVAQAGKKRYSPAPPEEFIEGYRGRMDKTLDSLKENLPLVGQDIHISYIWNMTHYHDFIDKARRMAESSRATLLVSTWREELVPLREVLRDKERQGIKIAVVHFGQPEAEVGRMFVHPIENTIYAEKGGRGFVLVRDGREAMMGTVMTDERVEGAWSKNRGFVTLAEDYIKHDIYIMKIVARFDGLLVSRFGDNYRMLRDIYQDKEADT
jgi:sugar-specific transcriptional regulator TrmB